MNLHLAEIGRAVAPGAHAVLVFDGAGWHTSPAFVVPDNVTLLCLPRYAPELNPIENVWEYLRQNHLAIRVYDSYDAILDACCTAWTALLDAPARLASITARDWARV
jgi:transposase